MSYLRTLQSILPHITAAGGKAIAVTAEPEQRLADTINATGYSGDVIVDTKNKIAADLKQRINFNVAISSKSGYEHGIAQPAILVLRNDGTVLFD